jgi:peptide/nickel transport system ATP-binding protein
MTTGELLSVRGLSVRFEGNRGAVPVLSDLDLAVQPGEILGVVGESGSGKSVLLRAIMGLLAPPWRLTAGQVLLHGEDLAGRPEREIEQVRGKTIALMLTNPRQHLNPVMPVGRQIASVILAHQNVSRKAATERSLQLLRDVGIPDPESRYAAYPHELSGGMCQRIIIAMGLANTPELLMADEPTSGLDVTISIQILDLMRRLARELGSALLLVSRDLGVVANYCERVVVMYAGQVVEEAPVLDFFDRPIHPYSRHLIRAAVAARDTTETGGEVVRGARERVETGCIYAPRCPVAVASCTSGEVALETFRPEHRARCLRGREIEAGELAP